MKRYIKSSSADTNSGVRTYQNHRNKNKFIETKKYADGHSVARQYMKWDTPEGEVKNYTGSKSNRGRWFRAGKNTRDMMLEDYDEVVVDETIEGAAELDDRFTFSFDDIEPEFWLKTTTEPAKIYLEDEHVIGNGAGMEYEVVIAIPRSEDHWQMESDIQENLDRHVRETVDGTDYYGNTLITEVHSYPRYANVPDDVYEDSVFYSAIIDIVPYDNIGPYGDYGIDFGVEPYEDDVESSTEEDVDSCSAVDASAAENLPIKQAKKEIALVYIDNMDEFAYEYVLDDDDADMVAERYQEGTSRPIDWYYTGK